MPYTILHDGHKAIFSRSNAGGQSPTKYDSHIADK